MKAGAAHVKVLRSASSKKNAALSRHTNLRWIPPRTSRSMIVVMGVTFSGEELVTEEGPPAQSRIDKL